MVGSNFLCTPQMGIFTTLFNYIAILRISFILGQGKDLCGELRL